MVSFAVTSPIITLPIKDIMDLLGRHLEEGIFGVFRHVVTTSSYEQIIDVAKGSPLSPVIGMPCSGMLRHSILFWRSVSPSSSE
jgi:hypothetical protein